MKHKKKDKILLVFFLFILPIVSASPEVDLSQPINTNYTYTLNIPLTFTTTGTPDNCYWTIDAGAVNNTINCDPLASEQFSVDYNGNYNFTLYVEKTINSSRVQDSVYITINDNFSEGTGIISASIIGMVLMIAVFFMIASKITEGGLKILFFFTSLFLALATIYFFEVMIMEFVKNPNIESVLIMLSRIIWAVIFASIFYFFYTYLRDIYMSNKNKKLGLEEEDEEK
jgi:hypothetical protein